MKKVEGLKLFYVVTPFEGLGEAVLDREGPWTQELLENHTSYAAETGAPSRAGLLVWEGTAETEPDELVGGWDFEGTWRGPTPEEMARLAVGKFPLRGHAFPATGEEEDFDVDLAKLNLAPCTATAHDAGTGQTLTCAMLAHGPDEDHVADGMRWRDGEAPRGFMGRGRR
jgi:hypothetical protein